MRIAGVSVNRSVPILVGLLVTWFFLSQVNRAGSLETGAWAFLLALQESLLYVFPAFVIGSVCHELAHAYVAWLGGDPTAKMMGRITFNPLKHLDVMGTLLIFIAHVGWAKPVPITRSRLRNPKRDFILAAAAGPLANLLLAALSVVVIKLFMPQVRSMGVNPLFDFFVWMALINAMLGIFNLIPIAPLDGSRFLELLPPRTYWSYKQYEQVIMIVFVVALLMGAFDPLFRGVQHAVFRMISG